MGTSFCVISIALDVARVPNQNGVSPQYIMLEIHHSGREPSIVDIILSHSALDCVDRCRVLSQVDKMHSS